MQKQPIECILSIVAVLRQYDGETLTLTNVQRSDMGIYLCIASNGVPPSVSKRFNVVVHCEYIIISANFLPTLDYCTSTYTVAQAIFHFSRLIRTTYNL